MFLGIAVVGKGNRRIKSLWDWSIFGGQNKCGANNKKYFYAISLVCFYEFFPRNFNTSPIHNQCPVNEMVSTDDTGCNKDGRILF